MVKDNHKATGQGNGNGSAVVPETQVYSAGVLRGRRGGRDVRELGRGVWGGSNEVHEGCKVTTALRRNYYRTGIKAQFR